MMHIKVKNNTTIYPYNVNSLYSEYPTTSFPNNIHTDYTSLKHFGVYVVRSTQQPAYDALSEKCVELTPEFVNDEWIQQWKVEPLSEENKQAIYNSKAAEVRANRYRLLAETDWTQFKDISTETSEKYVIYRQQLRDIGSQEGFPFNIVWPTLPV